MTSPLPTPYIQHMATDLVPDPINAPVQANLYQLLAPFTGYRYRFLLELLKDPTRSTSGLAAELGIVEQVVYNWRNKVPGFTTAMDAIKEGRADLRTEYAKLAFLQATPKVADAMVERAQGTGNAAQRAGERILETTGVLPKPGPEQPQGNVQIQTFTYYLIPSYAEAAEGKQPRPVIVETTQLRSESYDGQAAKELPAPKLDLPAEASA